MQWWIILALVAVAVYFFAVRKQGSSQNPKSEQVIPNPAISPKMDLTFDELSKYTQDQSQYVFIALKGVIYNVSASEFYKKPSGYAVFAGHDASVNLAKMSHQSAYLNKFGEISLNSEEANTLDDWVRRFDQKYPVVGKVIQ